jgi:hypothetical protein
MKNLESHVKNLNIKNVNKIMTKMENKSYLLELNINIIFNCNIYL